jgi:predicted dehydrogenase
VRLPDAFYVSGQFLPLTVQDDNVEVVLYADWRYTHQPVLTCRSFGMGTADLTTIQNLSQPTFRRIIYRLLRCPIGALAVIESSFTAVLQQTFSVTGENGAIELPHDAFIPWEKDATFLLRGANDEHRQIVRVPGADEYQIMTEHFANAVQGHAQRAISPRDSVNQMRVLDALSRAARSGELVHSEFQERVAMLSCQCKG